MSSLQFYNKFLPNLQDLLEPLIEEIRGLSAEVSKRRRNSPAINISERAREAFGKVQKLLKTKLILWHIDPKSPFYLFVDRNNFV